MSSKVLKEMDVLEWNAKHETRLFVAMMGRKPVGVNRHFMMACIHDKFSKLLNRPISSGVIWKHLDTLYDMAALHESEIIPFPNDEVEFELPEEFDNLAVERVGITLPHSEKHSDLKTTTMKYGKKSTYSNKGKQTLSSLNSSKASDSNTSKSSINSQSPVTVKTNKGIVSSKSEPKDENESVSTKVKVDSPAVSKNLKNKRSSMLNSELKIKHDANLSPQVKVHQTSESQVKKATKVESSTSSKKGSKETSKSDHGENVKKSKEVSGSLKKTKHVSNTENSGSRRNSKVDTPATKKKSDEAGAEKTSDIKSSKADSRKGESEADSSSSIGSSKISRAPSKGGSGDTPKKRKRVRTEEPTSLKKASPAPKRRR